MTNIDEIRIYEGLKADCKKCFGLCCVALYFSASEGFPTDKKAGNPCINLQKDFTCAVHKTLRKKGLKGCTSYDCFGAGQKVAQVTCRGEDWRTSPNHAKKVFDAFIVMRQLHEMIWYLMEAFILQNDSTIKKDISVLIDITEKLTLLDIDSFLAIDIEAHRNKVNNILKNTSEFIRNKYNLKNKNRHVRKDYFGANLKKVNLRGADLRGACLIASNLSNVDLTGADFIAADLRDANICGANLKNSIFLTQSQINTAIGDKNTKLPKMLVRPSHWESKNC